MRKLTKTAEEIMQIIWALGPCTVSDIRQYIHEKLGLKEPPHSTVSTIVRALESKGFLSHKAYGRTYEYHPLVSKETYSKSSLKSLIRNYFGGSVDQMVSFLVKKEELSLEELSELIKKLENEDNSQDHD